jgi:hypothetical protein
METALNAMARRKPCAVCARPMRIKRGGRKRQFCSDRCRCTAKRQRVFEASFSHFRAVLARDSAAPENAPKTPVISNVCKTQSPGRASIFGPSDWPIDLMRGDGGRLEPGLTAFIIRTELPELRTRIKLTDARPRSKPHENSICEARGNLPEIRSRKILE